MSLLRLKPTRRERIVLPVGAPSGTLNLESAIAGSEPAAPALSGILNLESAIKSEPALPSASRIILNALGAAGRSARALATGHALHATGDEAARRLALCQVCDYFRTSDERCGHTKCGCHLRVKTALNAEFCPAGKW